MDEQQQQQVFVASIDQGTSSTRCIIFDGNGAIRSSSQLEHEQFYPQPGWVEHDAEQIWVSNEIRKLHLLKSRGFGVTDMTLYSGPAALFGWVGITQLPIPRLGSHT